MYELKDWYLYEREGVVAAKGLCYGHPEHEDGKSLRTSAIAQVEADETGFIFTTQNSVFQALLCEHRSIESNLLHLLQIESCSLSDDGIRALEARAFVARAEALEERRPEIERLLNMEASSYVHIAIDSGARFYFRQMEISIDGKKRSMAEGEADIHTGMFQDSVLLLDNWQGVEIDFRFYPYARNRMSFYSWCDDAGPVLFTNVGKEAVEVDTPYGKYNIPAGETCLAASYFDKFSLEKPLVPDVDRHSVYEPTINEYNETMG